MITSTDARNGVVKTSWNAIRQRIELIEPQFTKIVDQLAPDETFSLYLAYYPYGANDADTESSLFPDGKNNYYRITDTIAPKEIAKDLGYSQNSTPLGMVLEKQIECFIDLKNKNITIPWYIYTPGKIFPLTRALHQKNHRIYAPNGLLSSTAGARSVFMLPNIGCLFNHVNLQRDFSIQSTPPKSHYEHWNVFKEIINSKVVNSDWRCCVMYFSEKWIEKIQKDKAWYDLKNYLHEIAWRESEYDINKTSYDIIFSIIQQN